MVSNILDVVSAYKKSGGIIDEAGGNATASDDKSFSNTLKGFLTDGIATLHEGEQNAIASVSGTKTDLAGVVTAIGNAETVLTEVVAIRDKVISAYQNITSGAI